ncbi:MAG: ABC transporter permease subunit [Nitrospira sp.]|nr:ABC transporter permease subunit [Nitrospira sp.]MBS0173664.1 ABC transporter permease subunit [Nitrospira sp.]MBX3339435.1 ABC transporter permease subunit [Nitrospira sp.]MCW5780174.1 ABC transporter permease subunit [Nitrospira sp.]HNA26746.1 ABC transporter permease subunit [Nitrospira sp.]
MGAIGVIAVNAFRESLRDKILYNLVLFAGLLIGLSVLLADLSITEHHKVIADMGLAAINLIGVIIAIFVGISLVNKEIERRTIYTIMARPISRTFFILGKYLGLALTLFVNLAIMLAVFLLTLWLYHVPVERSLFQAVELIFVEILVVTAIALFFSTFTSTTLSAIFTLGLYVIGHLTSDLRSMVVNSENGTVKTVVDLFYYLCPNLEMLNIKGQAAVGIVVAPEYLVLASLYGLLYAGVLLTGACLVFHQRDF